MTIISEAFESHVNRILIDVFDVLTYAIEKHKDQKRKYSDIPYIIHPIDVAKFLIENYPEWSCDMVKASILHDVDEDTDGTIEEIREKFGNPVARLVEELTDVYTKENYPHLNRSERKKLERQRLSTISKKGKIIKLIDLINNRTSIVDEDKDFAEVYLKEMKLTMSESFFDQKDEPIYKIAEERLQKGELELYYHKTKQ